MHGHIVNCLESFDRSRAGEHQGCRKLSGCSGNHASRVPARRQLQQPTGCLYTVRTANVAAAALVLSHQWRSVRGYRYRPQQQTRRDSSLAAARWQAPLSLPAGMAVTPQLQPPMRPRLQAQWWQR
jgi:hypothetical protein